MKMFNQYSCRTKKENEYMVAAYHHYHPVQPSTNGNSQGILYRESQPDARLKPFIHCYWELKTTRPLHESFTYRVVADGCTDIFFERSIPEQSVVMGFSTKNTRFPLGHVFHYTGVRFLPMAFPLLFRLDASELTNKLVPMDAISKDVSGFIAARMTPSMPFGQVTTCFDNHFLSSFAGLGRKPETSPALFNAIETILKTQGDIKIEKELSPGLSPRQLRRLFNRYIGGTPKTFSRVVRFQHTLNNMITRQNQPIEPIFHDAGYFDQAHFIREFRQFYGTTPGRAIQS